MGDFDTKKISANENSDLEKPFLKSDIAAFIKTMSYDKAPGITGITPSFYKVFWGKIGDLVKEAVNSCLKITLSPKSKK